MQTISINGGAIMAIAVTDRKNIADKKGNRTPADIIECMLDNENDINELEKINCEMGSTAFIINTGNVYILGSNGWVKI